MKPFARTFLIALTSAVLVLALTSGVCQACGIGASSGKGGCCTPDGRCKTSSDKVPSQACSKSHSLAGLAERTAQVQPPVVYGHVEVTPGIQPVFNQHQALRPLIGNYSPPDVYLLNAALLI